jgi:hypothetical protein
MAGTIHSCLEIVTLFPITGFSKRNFTPGPNVDSVPIEAAQENL